MRFALFLLSALSVLSSFVRAGGTVAVPNYGDAFPVEDITISITADSAAGSTLQFTPVLNPPFETYGGVNLNYGAEIQPKTTGAFYFSWSVTFEIDAGTSYWITDCGSSATLDTEVQTDLAEGVEGSNVPSYCPAKSVSLSGTNGGTVTLTNSQVSGNTWVSGASSGLATLIQLVVENTIQWNDTANDDDRQVNDYLIYTVQLYNSAPGYNILSVGTDGLKGNFYDVGIYNVGQSGINSYYLEYSEYVEECDGAEACVPVLFYLAYQENVIQAAVEECPGLSCNNCPPNPQTSSLLSLTTNPSIQGMSVSSTTTGNFLYQEDVNQYGQYVFWAHPDSDNCVRFIQFETSGTNGAYDNNTISIDVWVANCWGWTCTECVSYQNPNSGHYLCGYASSSPYYIDNSGASCVPVSADGEYSLNDQYNEPFNYIWDDSVLAVDNLISYDIYDDNLSVRGFDCQAVIKGDPRISGLQGQEFQVHGTPNEYFNLISTADVQVNSRFVYLEEGRCDNFTACFNHAGTYIDEIGVMAGNNRVRIVASAIDEAARVFIDGKEVSVSAHKHSAGTISVSFTQGRKIVVRTPLFVLTISQSDRFFNIETSLLATYLLDEGSKAVTIESSYLTEANTVMHGLIGQTYRNNVYAGGREYEGEVPDYQVADGLWGSDFKFNLYKKL